MTDNPTISLEDALDAFAQDILAKAKLSDNLAEMLKAFETVGVYAKARQSAVSVTPAASTKKGSKFAKLRNDFNGHRDPASRRRGKASAEAEADADASPTH
jgi:hypothetical protein